MKYSDAETVLKNNLTTFKDTTREVLSTFVSPHSFSVHDWKTRSSFHSAFDSILITRSDNSRYAGFLIVGANTQDLTLLSTNLFGISGEETTAVLRDFGSTLAAEFHELPDFIAHFKTVCQKPPEEAVQYAFFSTMSVADSQITFPGIAARLYLGFGIHIKNRVEIDHISNELSSLIENL
ncbi:MAG: hypothetical protein ACQEQ4_02425 [Fibrobacterota bacterium]